MRDADRGERCIAHACSRPPAHAGTYKPSQPDTPQEIFSETRHRSIIDTPPSFALLPSFLAHIADERIPRSIDRPDIGFDYLNVADLFLLPGL